MESPTENTQPMNSQTGVINFNATVPPSSYGKLEGDVANFGTIDLCIEKFTVGRDPLCSLVIREVPLHRGMISFISGVHFTLEKDLTDLHNPTYIIDHSTNGTFVNGRPVGKNNRVILLPNSKISIAKWQDIFVYTERNYNIPQEVRSAALMKQYHFGRAIGSGSFGTVYLLHDQLTCQPYALKVVKKFRHESDFKDASSLMNEANIMTRLNHVNPFLTSLIRMFDMINDSSSISMLLEYMKGGDLLTRITNNRYLSEPVAKFFFYQLCHALHYLHSKGIVHRDLKPDNVLLKDNQEYTLLKVSDFGTSKYLNNTVFMRTICGTPEYVAPEMLDPRGQNLYTAKVDIWSLGVILYTMLSGLLPFGTMDGMSGAALVSRGIFSMSQPVWRSLHSCRPKKLIYDILNVDPNKRPSIEMLLESSWFYNSDVVQRARCMMNLPTE